MEIGDVKAKDIEVEQRLHSLDSSAPTSPHEPEIDVENDAPSNAQAVPPNHALSIKSASSLTYYPPLVPRHERRGLFARITFIPETTDPVRYPRRTKWLITFIVAMAASAAPMGSATIMPALTVVSRDFHMPDKITNLSVALYMLSMSIFPLWWSSFSETLGRRTIYIVSFALFVLFAVLSAIASSIPMLIVMRMLSGGAAASVQAVGAGTIADIWEPKERGRAMGIFYLGPLCGPLFAPIIGGALTQGFGWRATQWFLVIFGSIVLCGLTLFLPETLKMRRDILDDTPKEKDRKLASNAGILGIDDDTKDVEATGKAIQSKRSSLNLQRTVSTRSVKEKTQKWVKILKRCLLDPLKIILLLRYPAVAISVYYASITFGSLYFLNISIERTFSKPPYNFSTVIVGLLYIPNSIGYFLASIFGGPWLDHIMKREARKKGRIDEKGGLILRPEDRMKENAWFAAFMFPAALIWYGWSVEKGVLWIVPVRSPLILPILFLFTDT